MNRLKELRQLNNMTQDELGERLGIQKAAVSKYETGRVALPPDTLMKLCDIFSVSADYILGRDKVTPLFKKSRSVSLSYTSIPETVGVPLIGRVHAGLPILADENIMEYIPTPADDVAVDEYFYMEVEGDCMIGDFIPEGALVLVRMQPMVESGQIAVVRLGDEEVLLRRVKRLDKHLVLVPSNPKYEPMIVSANAAQIVGRVVEVRIRNI
ncbi:MAG: helix-turn-helix domain-containing protein [Clostridia bacterium]|nr:helix-turn-helix domain-containing protein [Clostridia bacterium]